jgi:DNA-directed RNA polymerase subunit M
MLFCPKCGAILKPKQEKGKRFLACGCGYTNRKEKAVISEKVEEKEEIAVVEEEQRNLPETEAECPECGHDKAGYWTAQTRAGDEPETRFMKCTKCGHTWRDAS